MRKLQKIIQDAQGTKRCLLIGDDNQQVKECDRDGCAEHFEAYSRSTKIKKRDLVSTFQLFSKYF